MKLLRHHRVRLQFTGQDRDRQGERQGTHGHVQFEARIFHEATAGVTYITHTYIHAYMLRTYIHTYMPWVHTFRR